MEVLYLWENLYKNTKFFFSHVYSSNNLEGNTSPNSKTSGLLRLWWNKTECKQQQAVFYTSCTDSNASATNMHTPSCY